MVTSYILMHFITFFGRKTRNKMHIEGFLKMVKMVKMVKKVKMVKMVKMVIMVRMKKGGQYGLKMAKSV